MQEINPRILREYDIRGIVGEDLDTEVVELLGRAYGTYMARRGRKSAALGRDCRLSSPELARAFSSGVTSAGVDVVDIGMVTTPMVYFSLYNLDVEGGAMITASHNPAEYNGIKLCIGTDSLYGEEVREIGRLASAGDFEAGSGSVTQVDIIEPYVAYLRENLDIKPGLRVAIDCGNATVGIVGPRVLREFGCELTELYTEPDGTFPNHHPDPSSVENMQDLIKAVREGGLDVGLGFDGDGDRIGVVDERGEMIWGDMLLLIFARDIVPRVPGATVIGEVKSSTRLYREIERIGGNPIMWKTGHSLIKSKMKEEGAEVAGEVSGHVFFKHRFFGYDDALYTGLRLLEILSETGKKVSELLAGVPHAFSTPEIRVDCPDDMKFELVARVRDELRSEYEINDIDGLRIEFPDGWGLLRASNTQPALVLRFEARSEERLAEIRSLIESRIADARARMAGS